MQRFAGPTTGRRLSRVMAVADICKHFGWRRPGGIYAIDSVRLLLVRWEKRGLLRLPPPTRGQPRPRGDRDETGERDFESGETNGRLVVWPITDDERPRWRALMRKHHYLGDGGAVGETLRYVALEGGKPVAVVCWSAAALYNGPRDRYLGWDSATQKRRLHLVANNVRFGRDPPQGQPPPRRGGIRRHEPPDLSTSLPRGSSSSSVITAPPSKTEPTGSGT